MAGTDLSLTNPALNKTARVVPTPVKTGALNDDAAADTTAVVAKEAAQPAVAADSVKLGGGTGPISSAVKLQASEATQKALKMFDASGDNALNADELDKWVAQVGGDAGKAAKAINTDGDLKISKAELEAAYTKDFAAKEAIAAKEAAAKAAADPAAGAPAAALAEFKPAGLVKSGSQGEDVKGLQERLTTLKDKEGKPYLEGGAEAVDGQFGPKTRAAVERFQADQQAANPAFKRDGIVGPETTKSLNEATTAQAQAEAKAAAEAAKPAAEAVTPAAEAVTPAGGGAGSGVAEQPVAAPEQTPEQKLADQVRQREEKARDAFTTVMAGEGSDEELAQAAMDITVNNPQAFTPEVAQALGDDGVSAYMNQALTDRHKLDKLPADTRQEMINQLESGWTSSEEYQMVDRLKASLATTAARPAEEAKPVAEKPAEKPAAEVTPPAGGAAEALPATAADPKVAEQKAAEQAAAEQKAADKKRLREEKGREAFVKVMSGEGSDEENGQSAVDLAVYNPQAFTAEVAEKLGDNGVRAFMGSPFTDRHKLDKLPAAARQEMVAQLEAGWTSGEEYQMIDRIKASLAIAP